MEDIFFAIPLIQGGAFHTDQDRHNTDDRPEDFIEIVQANHRLRHLQQRSRCIRLFLCRIIETRVLNRHRGVTCERGRHCLGFVTISTGCAVSESNHSIGLVAHSQRHSQRRIILLKSGRQACDPDRVGWLPDDRLI